MNRVRRVGVVGLGAMGSAAALHLARRGVEVVGFEAFGPAHDRGSSHGESRIIRQAYYEDPAYVPLLRRAYQLWRELESQSGQQLLRLTGGMLLGAPDSEVITGSLASCRQWGLPCRELTALEVKAEFPAFRPGADLVAVVEPEAGVLTPEAAISAHLAAAQAAGADLHFHQRVRGWEMVGTKVAVRTDAGRDLLDGLVVAAGAWTTELLNGWALPLRVERQLMVWLRPRDPHNFQPGLCPVYLYERSPADTSYGFPALDGVSLKLARHHGGEVTSPDRLRRGWDRAEAEDVRSRLAEVMPELGTAAVSAAKVCMYTDTPDLNFALGLHPECPEVAVGCGFSGHGFKFSPVIGEILADLALEGQTRHPIGPLRADRLLGTEALWQHDYPAT